MSQSERWAWRVNTKGACLSICSLIGLGLAAYAAPTLPDKTGVLQREFLTSQSGHCPCLHIMLGFIPPCVCSLVFRVSPAAVTWWSHIHKPTLGLRMTSGQGRENEFWLTHSEKNTLKCAGGCHSLGAKNVITSSVFFLPFDKLSGASALSSENKARY